MTILLSILGSHFFQRGAEDFFRQDEQDYKG